MNSLKKLEALIHSGEHKVAINLIENIKTSRLTTKEIIKYTDFCLRLDLTDKALTLLGKERSKSEIEYATEDEIHIQLKLAEVLNFLGAKYVSQRIYLNLEQKRTTSLSSLHFLMCKFYLSRYDYRRAFPYARRAAVQNRGTYRGKISMILLADSLEGIGYPKLALKIAREVLKLVKDDEKILRAICLQAKGEYLIRMEKFEDAKSSLNASVEIFNGRSNTKDSAYAFKWLGVCEYYTGNLEQASKYLKNSLAFLDKNFFQPIAKIEILYWIYVVNPKMLIFLDEVAIRCHPNQSPFSRILGRNVSEIEQRIKLSPWVKKQIKKSKNDSWILRSNAINTICYFEFIKTRKLKNLLDLYSGVYFKSGEVIFLTSIQSRLLLALYACGSFGMFKYALSDFVYREDFFEPELGPERLRKLVKEFQKLNIKIIYKNNYYFLAKKEWNKDVILPMDLSTKSTFDLILSRRDSFTTKDVTRILCIKERKANRLIKNWLNQKLIVKERVGRKIIYKKLG